MHSTAIAAISNRAAALASNGPRLDSATLMISPSIF
jgi:hypothetical protein